MRKLVLLLFSTLLSISMFLPAAGQVLADSAKGAEIVPVKNAELMIRMVSKVDVGQPVVITVYSKRGYNTVAQAMVYALNSSQITIPADIANYSITGISYTDTALSHGIFIGYTGDDGKVEYRFQETGKYLIIAIKDGYASGLDSIEVNIAAAKGLFIRGPVATTAGKQVVFKVTERDYGIPVDNVEMYAKKIGDLNTQPVVDSSAETPYEVENADDIKTNGIFMGYSDNGGIVRFQFEQTGYYVLVALKNCYSPGFARLVVQGAVKEGLIIRAPESAQVDRQVIMTVINRQTSDNISGAAIYAIKGFNIVKEENKNKVMFQNNATVQQVPQPVLSASANETGASVIAVINPTFEEVKQKGVLLGYTDENGQLSYSFDAAGRYMLVAVVDGYNPGYSRINVKDGEQNYLGIRAPGAGLVDQVITITVVERNSSQPVEAAAVYALKINLSIQSSTSITDNGTATQFILEAGNNNADEYVNEALQEGILIGYTDENGQVSHSFNETGRYIITASKDCYQSAFRYINMQLTIPDGLVVMTPSTAQIGEQITIKVINKLTQNPEEGASVYELDYDDIIKPVLVVNPSNNETGMSSRAESYADIAMSTGKYIGDTDSNGEVICSFGSIGRHVIVAIKDGFLPGFSNLNIKGMLRSSLLLEVEAEIRVNEIVTIGTFDRNTNEFVPDVDIYAYRIDGFTKSLQLMFRETFSFGSGGKENLAVSMSKEGFYVGATDESGMLTYSVGEEGRYLLIAVKSGYTPDFTRINVISAEIDLGGDTTDDQSLEME